MKNFFALDHREPTMAETAMMRSMGYTGSLSDLMAKNEDLRKAQFVRNAAVRPSTHGFRAPNPMDGSGRMSELAQTRPNSAAMSVARAEAGWASALEKALAGYTNSAPAQAAAPRPQGPTLENQTLAQLIDARRQYGSVLGGQIGTRAYGGVPGVPRAGYAQGYAPAKIEIPADQQKLLEPAQAPRNPIMTASWR